MTISTRFAYVRAESGRSAATILAYLPIQLNNQKSTVSISALVDSGSTVNVLPYSIGLQLGLVWEQQTTPVILTGSLARLPARGIIVEGQIDTLPSGSLHLPGHKQMIFRRFWDKSISLQNLTFASFGLRTNLS